MTSYSLKAKIRTKPRLLLGVAVFLGLMGLPACSKVQFGTTPTVAASCTSASPCVATTNGNTNFSFNITAASQAVDILFVIDNSDSMFAIQSQISQKFSSLFSQIQNFNYNIGIITTDIASSSNGSSPANGYGALQNGNLITFPDGSNVLTPSSVNPQSSFEQTITRPETYNCEQWVAQNCDPVNGCPHDQLYANACPSDDTRAIYALNLALANNENGFFRSGVPLTAVIISNSDERASGGLNTNYPLQANDEPQSFVSAFQSAYGTSVDLAVDSVLIRPGDTACYNSQKFTSKIFGWYGYIYSQLTQMTGGSTASVCATDYSSALASIGASAAQQIKSISLPCTPNSSGVTVQDASTGQPVSFTLSANSQSLALSAPLASGQTVTVTGTCSQ